MECIVRLFLRRNKEAGKKVNDLMQYGGAVITTWVKSPALSLKLGVYYNKEYYRSLFIPLVGIDWKMDDKNDLFGLLPSNLVYQHKVNKIFYWGATFHAVTNAYRMETVDPCAKGDCSGKNYLRVNDNQAGLFADTYITPKIVFTAEAGYTILRKYRYGFKGDDLHTYMDYKNDNFYIRASLATGCVSDIIFITTKTTFMRNLSAWGRNHKWSARFLIILSYVLLNWLGIKTGILLNDTGFNFSPLALFAFIAVFSYRYFMYPFKSEKRNSISARRILRKTKNLRSSSCCFFICMIVYMANHHNDLFTAA
ncbi:MAG: DUF6268 family outer membrane beta-barrel protein, partial [Chitinophagaceae bacterium]